MRDYLSNKSQAISVCLKTFFLIIFKMLYIILPSAVFNIIIRVLDHSPQGAIYTWVKWTSIKAKLWRNCYHYLVRVIKHYTSNSRRTKRTNSYCSQTQSLSWVYLSWHFQLIFVMVIRVTWVV